MPTMFPLVTAAYGVRVAHHEDSNNSVDTTEQAAEIVTPASILAVSQNLSSQCPGCSCGVWGATKISLVREREAGVGGMEVNDMPTMDHGG